MDDNNFKKYLSGKRRIVIKIGSQVLLDKNGKPSAGAFKKICEFSFSLIKQKKEVILVSSGAIAAGKDLLKINSDTDSGFTMPQKQAFAACGQAVLMRNYNACFKKYGIKTAQILLTKEDISIRKRFTNARNTIFELLNREVVPVINENDTVSYEEIKFSDNDHLSALVLNLVCADLLIILSNVNGVYDKNPNVFKGAKRIQIIDDIKDYIKNFKETSKSRHGTGGMKSKLYAAFIASSAGVDTIIASGKDKKSLNSLISGNLTGTLIASSQDKINKKKHWLLFGMEKAGEIVVDDGAITAITACNKSLLASGVIKIKGDFKKGDGVFIVNGKGAVFSKGVSNLDSNDIKKIKGLSSGEIKAKFGKEGISALVVHKDKMVASI